MAGEYYCTKYVGGTKVPWSNGYRESDSPHDAWQYCCNLHIYPVASPEEGVIGQIIGPANATKPTATVTLN